LCWWRWPPWRHFPGFHYKEFTEIGLQTVGQAGWEDGINSECGSNLVTVVGVETPGAASFHASHVAGKHVAIDKIDTIAKSLGAKKISAITFELSQRHPGHVSSMLVSDAQAANATWRFAGIFIHFDLTVDDQRLMVEIACGATVSLVYEGLLKEAIPNLTKDSTVVLVICGGNTVEILLTSGSSVTIESLMTLKNEYGGQNPTSRV
jgi:L-serine/L-threonine ammonia-lyase